MEVIDNVEIKRIYAHSQRKKKRKGDKPAPPFLTEERFLKDGVCIKQISHKRDGCRITIETDPETQIQRKTEIDKNGVTRSITHSLYWTPVGSQHYFYPNGLSKSYCHYDMKGKRKRVGTAIEWAENGVVTEYATYDENGSGKRIGPRVLRAANDRHVYCIENYSPQGTLQHRYDFNPDGLLRLEKIYDATGQNVVQSNVRRPDGSVASMRGNITDSHRYDFLYPDGVCHCFDTAGNETLEYYNAFEETSKEIFLLTRPLRDVTALFRSNKVDFDPVAFRAMTVGTVQDIVQKSAPGYKPTPTV